MTAVWYRFRAELRGSWKGHLAAALFLALVLGGSLTAFAGARRTVSAMPRMVEETRAEDVMVNPDRGTLSRITPEGLSALPQTEEMGAFHGMLVIPRLPDGSPDDGDSLALAATGVAGDRISRPLVLEGRPPDPNTADEVLVNPEFAERFDLAPGDTLPVLTTTLEKLDAWQRSGADLPEFEPAELTVAGIGRYVEEVETEEAFTNDRVTLTPAFHEAHRDDVPYWGGVVRLRPDVTQREFEAAVQALAPGEAVAFQWTKTTVDRFQNSVRPQGVALAGFGGVLGAVGLVGLGMVLTRHADGTARERLLALSMGMPSRSLAALGGLHGAVIGVVAALGGAALAVALSPLTPIGPARRAEPDPGLLVDVAVLALGVGTVVFFALSWGAGATWLARRRAGSPARETRPSRLVQSVAGLGGSPAAVVGSRMAVERGAGAQRMPVRMTLGGAAVAVAAVVAAATFTSSLDRVVSTPQLYGSNWDATAFVLLEEVTGAESFANSDDLLAAAIGETLSRLDAIEEVQGVSVATFGQIPAGDGSVPAFGIDPVRGAAHPTLVEGRLPRTPAEVVLGTRTLRSLDLDVGADFTVDEHRLHVVGRAVFPGYAEYPGQDKTALGDGAWLTPDGLRSLTADFEGRTLFIDVADGADAEALLADLVPGDSLDENVVFHELRPVEVDTLQRVRTTPATLAALLGMIGVVAVTYVLVTAIRRRRRLIALLRVLGFTRRQVTTTLLWNAAVVAGIAVAVGIPFGVVAGRWSWATVIERLGGEAGAVVPWALALAAVAATFATAVLASILPARAAGRVRPAVVLRAE